MWSKGKKGTLYNSPRHVFRVVQIDENSVPKPLLTRFPTILPGSERADE